MYTLSQKKEGSEPSHNFVKWVPIAMKFSGFLNIWFSNKTMPDGATVPEIDWMRALQTWTTEKSSDFLMYKLQPGKNLFRHLSRQKFLNRHIQFALIFEIKWSRLPLLQFCLDYSAFILCTITLQLIQILNEVLCLLR